ncbi:MAG: DUF1667 domain-containing protein [Deltaproteobacteria bacterium]|nr:DUF1667 domain-containing protein [Deltaproteobacteria bacterium]
MKRKELTCIVCPNGCPLEIDFEEKPVLQITRIEGHTCDKGPKWAEQELTRPMRTISSNIKVENGDFPLVSVRTDAAIPKNSIFQVMEEIQSISVKAPVAIGEILIKNPAGTDCRIIATRYVNPI